MSETNIVLAPSGTKTFARVVGGSVVALGVALGGCGANASNPDAGSQSPQVRPPSIVIAAVELQFEDPMPGGQSVWLANRGTSEQDISCWGIMAKSSGVTALVNSGTRLAPGHVFRFVTPARMLGSPDVVTLVDRTGRVVDQSPELSDTASDDQRWYLLPGESWRFGRARLPEIASDGRLVSAC